jgi:hypothetical protein
MLKKVRLSYSLLDKLKLAYETHVLQFITLPFAIGPQNNICHEF